MGGSRPKVVIPGGYGFLGQVLGRRLSERGWVSLS